MADGLFGDEEGLGDRACVLFSGLHPSLPVRHHPDENEWETVLPRLLLWTQRLHARVLMDIRGAPTPADLVQDAVTDVLSGRRSRPPGLPLAVVLYGVIRSRAHHVLARAKTTDDVARARFVGMEEAASTHMALTESPDTDDLRRRVLLLVGEDEVLTQMVNLWFEDPALKASDIAEMLGLSPHDVYAATRRLRRKNVSRSALGLDETAFVVHLLGEFEIHQLTIGVVPTDVFG